MSARGSSIELYVQSYKDVIAKIGAEFEDPDDDWSAMLILEGEESRHLMPLDMRSERDKEFYTHFLIPMAIREYKPSLVAEVTSAWMVMGGPDSDVLSMPASKHPRRKEVVILTIFSLDDLQMWTAEIHRSKYLPPKLGVWELHAHDEMTGRFVDPVREAMRANEEES